MCYIVSENILCGQVYMYIYSHARLLSAVGVGRDLVRSVEIWVVPSVTDALSASAS